MSRILFFLGIFIVIAVAWAISRRRQSLSIQERDELEELRRNERGLFELHDFTGAQELELASVQLRVPLAEVFSGLIDQAG